MSRDGKNLTMLVQGDALRMGDPYGDDVETVEKLVAKYGLSAVQVRDILDEAADADSDDY